jgi:hypothetical protein
MSDCLCVDERFDTADGSIKFLPVENFPSKSEAPLDYSTAVTMLNRIYIFGGWHGKRFLDGIWYIDLPTPPTLVPETVPTSSPPPSSPKLFDCSKLANGNHPHQTIPASFFICCYGTQFGVSLAPVAFSLTPTSALATHLSLSPRLFPARARTAL